MSKTCCCGCCPVGRGTLLIGIVNTILYSACLIENCMRLNRLINHADKLEDQIILENLTAYITYGFVFVSMQLLYVVLSCLLVHGYRSRNLRFVTPCSGHTGFFPSSWSSLWSKPWS
ncbi:uncharacterized protein LOC110859675 [Folsomia candida]|uniref:uncharacterized protein LOC110859675 n=1 Tax=Folsomia candida TaxID=158441 RepID=UPI000B8F0213|nr:uncharacterized protein LOC110859675 [Folsomia candida]